MIQPTRTIGHHSLWLGDSVEVMQTLPSQSFDLILCDLPYGTTQCTWDIVIPFEKLWPNYKRLIKPNGTILLFGNQPFTSLLIASNLPWYKQCLVWDKNKCGSPALAKIRPMQIHEDIVVFAPGKTVYNPIMEAGKPYKRESKRAEGYVGRCNHHGYGLKPRTSFENHGTRYPKSIIRISRDFSAQQQVHPTQKPVPLCEYLIRTYSHEGAHVLDNTMGSGSTGVGCANTNRIFTGIEDKPHFFDISVQRMLEACGYQEAA